MTFDSTAYVNLLRDLYAENADIETAFGMEKYMKNKFSFFGLKKPLRDIIIKEFVGTYGLPPPEALDETVRICWQMPEREMQYYAMMLLFKLHKKMDASIINLYEDIITQKSWWDTIDYIAVNLVGNYFKMHPQNIPPVTNKWMSSGNIWLQRSCILFQLKYKKETDTKLLYSFIEPLTESKEFFISKSIGWALREYSKTNPEAVISFVEKTPMQNLSKREALRWLKK